MSLPLAKRIADPVYGSIGLTDLEVRVIDTEVFQRLRRVKHLGLAEYVFPGAAFSRFEHSLGVCHITGRILEALRGLNPRKVKPKEVQKYRLAALLHDIGHYPFSHPMEDAARDFYSGGLLEGRTTPSSAQRGNDKLVDASFFGHERAGREILNLDEDLRTVLVEGKFEPNDLSALFMGEERKRFANLVKSDLDADRIDYLLRTSHHTGLPYGSVDVDYLISQMRLDNKTRICLLEKAIKTVDHFLLCRYFDYQQIGYHKSVAGLEFVLKDVIASLFDLGELNCSREWLSSAVKDGSWRRFDDGHVLEKIRALDQPGHDPVTQQKARCLLRRKPPKVVAQSEKLARRDEQAIQYHRTMAKMLREKIDVWAESFDIDRSLWWLWDMSGLALTAIGSHVSVGDLGGKSRYEEAVRVVQKPGAASVSILESQHSLMSVLADYALYMLRVYVLLPEGRESARGKIERQIKTDFPDFGWK